MPKIIIALLTLLSGVCSCAESRPSAAPADVQNTKSVRKNVNLPGLVINFQERSVDIEATICLDEGMLELIACTKETKEHESIVVISAKPMHVHTALLLLGSQNGNPAMQRQVGEQQTRWVNLPPRGDRIMVYLVFKNKEGEEVEHAISDFVERAEETPVGLVGGDEDGLAAEIKFPHTFLFAGSHLRDNGPGPRQYLADLSGNVISIATFGDELLCLPGVHGKGNDSLMWQVDARKLPKVGSKVTLRLRPQVKAASKTGKASPKD